MKHLINFNEEIIYQTSDFKIYREKGKLYFAFMGKYSWCKLPSAVEGVAMILDGTIGNKPEIQAIPLEPVDKKFKTPMAKEANIQDAIRWLWRAAKYVDTQGRDHGTKPVGGVNYYDDYKDESMLLSDGYFSRKYADPIMQAVDSAQTVGDMMDVMRGVKQSISKSFRAEKDMSKFDL